MKRRKDDVDSNKDASENQNQDNDEENIPEILQRTNKPDKMVNYNYDIPEAHNEEEEHQEIPKVQFFELFFHFLIQKVVYPKGKKLSSENIMGIGIPALQDKRNCNKTINLE